MRAVGHVFGKSIHADGDISSLKGFYAVSHLTWLRIEPWHGARPLLSTGRRGDVKGHRDNNHLEPRQEMSLEYASADHPALSLLFAISCKRAQHTLSGAPLR
jgi:hypothetical protein